MFVDWKYSPVHDHGRPTSGLRRRAKKQFAPPPDDCTELAEARPVIKSFFLASQDTHSKLEKTSKSRVGTMHLNLEGTDLKHYHMLNKGLHQNLLS
jgi:hypothetical protein